jgi:hypothetical protein
VSDKHGDALAKVIYVQRREARQQVQGGSVGARNEGGGDGAPPVVVRVLAHGGAFNDGPHLEGNVGLQVVGGAAAGLHQVEGPLAAEHVQRALAALHVVERRPVDIYTDTCTDTDTYTDTYTDIYIYIQWCVRVRVQVLERIKGGCKQVLWRMFGVEEKKGEISLLEVTHIVSPQVVDIASYYTYHEICVRLDSFLNLRVLNQLYNYLHPRWHRQLCICCTSCKNSSFLALGAGCCGRTPHWFRRKNYLHPKL